MRLAVGGELAHLKPGKRGNRLVLSSLRIRLLAPVLVAVLPALGVLGYATIAQRRLLVAEAEGKVEQLARLVAELHQRPVDGARGLLLAVSHMQKVTGRDPGCSEQMATIKGHDPVYHNIGAVDLEGDVYCSAAPRPGKVNLSDRRFVQLAVASRGFGVGEYVISRIRGTASIGFGQAVFAKDGALQAVAFVSLDVAHLQQRLDALQASPGTDIEVLDRQGIIITARGHPERAGQPFDPARLRQLSDSEGAQDFPGADGVERIHALHRVMDSSGEPVLQVVCGIPKASLLGPVDAVTRRSLLAFVVLGILGAIAAGWAAEVLLVKKLKVLIATARRISAGDASARTGLQAGGEELGELIRATDEMAESLQRKEEAKKRLEEQLHHSQKMESMGRLAGGIAHDFNNLLTAILSGARMIEDELPEGHQARQDAAEIRGAGERAAALTSQLLAFSRRQVSAPRPVALEDVVRSLASLLRRLLGETIQLEVIVGARGLVLADPSQLEQVIVNLAVNARDAMPAGGRLTITVKDPAPGETPAACGPEAKDGARTALSVKDTGTGIPPEIRSRIFEPFFTTKKHGQGTGLGLSTVYGIVAQCGGSIEVSSAPGEGSEFVVCLPRYQGPLPEPGLVPRSTAPKGGSETILLVEDDGAVRVTAARILEKAGYTVLDAATPGVALALAKGHRGQIDLLLSDLLLPEEDGVTLSRRILEVRPGLRVAFMSGYAGEVLDTTLPPGCRFLSKPFTPDQLQSAVRQALET